QGRSGPFFFLRYSVASFRRFTYLVEFEPLGSIAQTAEPGTRFISSGLRPSWSGSATPLAERKTAQSLSQEKSTFRHVAEPSAAVFLLSSTFLELKLGLFIAHPFVVAVKESRPSDATLDLEQ